ncbi:septal ring lytic transglycosylase RlpA family protein [Nitrosomonas sp. Nm132]|jgi:rare lipoprotein A|nr:septal ring lytic transglycosylase RlpA family protein [Nitrosomonas sp. Nm132]SDH48878.1 rare lipoprotein A [Nitrosomonas sp. Nm132]
MMIESKIGFFKMGMGSFPKQYVIKLAESRRSGKSRSLMPTGALVLLIICLFSGCSAPIKTPTPTVSRTQQHAPYNKPYKVRGKTYYPMSSAVGYSEKGIASWYGAESGNRTAMGTRFYPQGISAAHKTLPLPTKVRVTNLRNGRAIDVIVNDRGPFKRNRLIDLSHGAAKKIGLRGLTEVKVEYLENVASNP